MKLHNIHEELEASDQERILLQVVKRNMMFCDPNDDLESKVQIIISKMFAGGGTTTSNLVTFYGDDLEKAVSEAIRIISSEPDSGQRRYPEPPKYERDFDRFELGRRRRSRVRRNR